MRRTPKIQQSLREAANSTTSDRSLAGDISGSKSRIPGGPANGKPLSGHGRIDNRFMSGSIRFTRAQKKRRPWVDRLFQETMKPSDRLRLALEAAAGEQAAGTQPEQREMAGGFRDGGGLLVNKVELVAIHHGEGEGSAG